jgi:hypothetical protein
LSEALVRLSPELVIDRKFSVLQTFTAEHKMQVIYNLTVSHFDAAVKKGYIISSTILNAN